VNTIEKTHLSYIGSILTLIIIILVTIRFADVPNLSERLNFGLTVTSLVLALLAIVYAFYSNASLTKNVTIMNEAAKDVSATSNGLSRVIEELSQKTDLIPTRLQTIEQMLSQPRESVLKNPVGDTEEVDKSEEEAKGQARTFEEKPKQEGDKKKPTDELATDTVDAQRITRRFLKTSSVIGLILLYACRLAFEKTAPFAFTHFAASTGIGDPQYVHGFLSAINGFGMIDAIQTRDIITIRRITERLPKEDVHKELLLRVEQNPTLKEWVSERMKNVETYFGKNV